MRWAHEQSLLVPADVWTLKGMSGAYDYVKDRSKVIGPNMSYVIFIVLLCLSSQTPLSLIYQLLEYERRLNPVPGSPSDALQQAEEEEWSRRRTLLDEAPSPPPEDEEENPMVMQEARALDKAMEDRMLARRSSRSSVSSVPSSAGSGVGMGSAWRTKYGNRKRSGSIASNNTGNSVLSEDLMEEDEEALATGFTDSDRSATTSSPSPDPRGNILHYTTLTRFSLSLS